MYQLLAIAGGGAVGALLRYWVSSGVYALAGRNFPYGTLAVNVAGSLLMGLLFVLLIERMAENSIWRAALLVGMLGAFTTFSTFSIETLNLMEEGAYTRALLNMVLSVLLCVAAAWLGVKIGRQI
ncbi:MAG: camphor resistance protein CrcB [Acidithiobacillales bacterium SG8_45]|jgi:CrcB protein|nr:MAG: camphor resistance protein CrcB [Acidithiobacillales bacterium SG8_45]